MNSPISRLGGKRNLVKKILPIFPPHKIYIEVFCGAAWLFFAKEPAKNEIINDIDNELVNLYRIFQNHPEEFINQLNQLFISRKEFEDMLLRVPRTLTDIQRAVKFYYLNKCGYASSGEHFCLNLDGRTNINYELISKTLTQTKERLKRTYIENLHYSKLIEKYNKEDALFYCDPPYYNHENDYGKGIFSKDDHDKLYELLSNTKGKFVLSINDVPYIRVLYNKYNIKEVDTVYTTAKTSKKKVTELLITNF